MPLIKTRFYDWTGGFMFTPPLRAIVINTEQIVRVEDVTYPSSGDRVGPHVRVIMTDGSTLQCEGPIDRYMGNETEY